MKRIDNIELKYRIHLLILRFNKHNFEIKNWMIPYALSKEFEKKIKNESTMKMNSQISR